LAAFNYLTYFLCHIHDTTVSN